MNRNDIDTNLLYSGKEILNFAINNIFEEGDKLIAIQEDVISNYIFKQYDNECYDFVDCEYPEETLDFFDLINCKFIVMLKEYSELSLGQYITRLNGELSNDSHNEIKKRLCTEEGFLLSEPRINFKNGSSIVFIDLKEENKRGEIRNYVIQDGVLRRIL
ncbi:hypothetical protein [Clostridium sp.]|uniref:hypothetical protein n=1 Tax=Clostridium sp. TaxID=1506 RepID=UPI00290EF2CB|nr:hypothetical protein [Clostridium sp.]MDU3410018.1 hypothetical protein [Clostridium sp.]